jgi:hypothetical protein
MGIVSIVTIEYQETPERFLGTGTVFAAWNPSDETFDVYWDSFPENQPSFPIEPGPRTSSINDVVAWGRERAPRVLVRPDDDPGEYYWAGAEEPTGTDAELKRLPL